MEEKKFSFLAGEYDSAENLNSDAPEIGKSKTWGEATPQQKKAGKVQGQEQTLINLRKEREKEENEDSPLEKRLMVINGATLKCPYAQSEGKLKVTSNELHLQDQVWATEGDCANMVNLQFQGVCNHLKWGSNKPSCMGVINLSPWQNTGTTIVQEQRVLVKESYITCNPTPNVATAKPIPKVDKILDKENYGGEAIKNAEWVQNIDNKEITCLLYGVKKVYVKVELWYPCNGKNINIKYKEYNSIITNTDLERDTKYPIQNDSLIQYCPITFTIDDYIKHDEDDMGEYIFEIKIGNEEYKPNKKLKVHAVIYIPEIMKHLGWAVSEQSQKEWFNAKVNDYPWQRDSIVSGLSLNWALGFKRIKEHYEKNKDKWKTPNAIKQLEKEINLMREDGLTIFPSFLIKRTIFGLVFDNSSLTNVKKYHEEEKGEVTERIPYFDKYHFQDIPYEESKNNPLDDFFGAVANFNFRFVAKGYLNYIKKGKMNVTITHIGIYIRDGFDFVDSGVISQPLGFWSLKQKKVSKSPVTIETSINPSMPVQIKDKSDYRYINNASYQDYQKDSKMGGNFYRYSDMKILNVNYTFEVNSKFVI